MLWFECHNFGNKIHQIDAGSDELLEVITRSLHWSTPPVPIPASGLRKKTKSSAVVGFELRTTPKQ
jgi:hypothetical protein